MEIEVIEPKRAPVKFNIDFDAIPEELVEVVKITKKVAEQVLYHWDVFPIVLPPPLFVIQATDENNKKLKYLLVRDLFGLPTFEEAGIVVSIGSKCGSQPLSPKQLQSIRETGEFEVESLEFPGQIHKWHLSELLQKGINNIHDTFLQDIAFAARLIVITARNRLLSDFFSVSQSCRAFLHGLAIFVDAVIGIPSLSAKNLDVRIQEERSKYLVAELTVKPNYEDDVDNLCQFVKHQIRKRTVEKYSLENEKPPPVPYLYQTPNDQEMDLRLFDKDIIRCALPELAHILEKESRGWFLPFREKVIKDLKKRKLSDEELERQANILVVDEYSRRVLEAILHNSELDKLGPEVASLLMDQAKSVILMQRAVENMHRRLRQTLSQLKHCLEELNPVLSRIEPWVAEKLNLVEKEFMLEHRWDAHEEALALCRQNHLDQASYFLHRDLTFMREREPVLKQELSRVRNPNRTFHWRTQIWSPHQWVIKKVFQGESELIPTVISRTSSSLAQPRSDPNQPVYLMETQRKYTTTTRPPFWRWTNYCYRTYSWLWNAMFLFGVVIPWLSPVSLRALFCIRPFIPDLEVNQIDGTLHPRRSSTTQTLCSRLLLLWRHISKSRTQFELDPDSGFIGKGLSRHLNRVWNYLIKGVFGTMFFVFIFPIICVCTSFVSLLITITAPLWMPVLTLIFHLLMIFFYDFDSPGLPRNKVCVILESLVWHIGFQGIVQPFLALIVAAVICPLLSLIVFVVAILRCSLRILWDIAMFHILIQRRGRVPVNDSCLVKRVLGPGLSNSYILQIRPEQALSGFEAKLEIEELSAFREEVERIILLPQQRFRDFVFHCFHPFSAALCKEGVYRELEKEAQELIANLRDQVERRKKELNIGLSAESRVKVKLSASDLQPVLHVASMMLQNFFPVHVLKRLQIDEKIFWDRKGLHFRDWAGFATQLLTELFSPEILTPLEEGDEIYKLKTNGADLSRYTEILHAASLQPNIDFSRVIHIPKGKIHVHSPYLDLNIFNPLSNAVNSVHKKEMKRPMNEEIFGRQLYPWKRKQKQNRREKLVIPLPLPHPAHIAVIMYNRENEDPIPLESDLCLEILKVIEDGAKTSTITNCDYEDSPADGQSMATADEYHAVTSDFDTSEDMLSMGRQLSRSQHSTGDSIAVNLASTEDVTLEPDDQKVTYSHSSYSTTV